jgi:hypothetical protein
MKYAELSKLEQRAVDWLTLTRPYALWYPVVLFALALWEFLDGNAAFAHSACWLVLLGIAAVDSRLNAFGVRRFLRRCDIEIDPPKARST